jgi:hypothetical protein
MQSSLYKGAFSSHFQTETYKIQSNANKTSPDNTRTPTNDSRCSLFMKTSNIYGNAE